MRTIHFFIGQLLAAGMAFAGCQPRSYSPLSSVQVSDPSASSAQYAEGENIDIYKRQHLAEEALRLDEEKLSITLQDIEPTLMKEGETLQLTLATEEFSNRRCNLIVRYPQIAGLRNTKLQTQLNAATRERSFNTASSNLKCITLAQNCFRHLRRSLGHLILYVLVATGLVGSSSVIIEPMTEAVLSG